MKTYSEKLKSPHWQRKRLEILNRDGFSCRRCGNKEETLHVHHLYYFKNVDPWDYPNSSLMTLCYNCHDFEHEDLEDSKKQLVLSMQQRGAMSSALYGLAVAFDFSGSNDRQMSDEEWIVLSKIVSETMKYRNGGGKIEDIFYQVIELTQEPEE